MCLLVSVRFSKLVRTSTSSRHTKLCTCKEHMHTHKRTRRRLTVPAFMVLTAVIFSWRRVPRFHSSKIESKGDGIHFLSFASSSYNLSGLKLEASLMNFSSVRICDEGCLKGTNFWSKHGEFVVTNKRGYGYWIWKYWLVLDLLGKLPTGSAVLYADGGCSLNPKGVGRLEEYRALARRNGGLLLFELDHSEQMYTKIDTGRRILPHNKSDTWGKQRVGGIFMVIKSPRTVKFFNEAMRIASERGYKFIDDSPSSVKEVPEFREHRHDQSITSMLSKQYGFEAIPDETYPLHRCYELGFPVIAARRKIPVNV